MGPLVLRSLAVLLAVIPSGLSLIVEPSKDNPAVAGAYIVEFEESASVIVSDVSDNLMLLLSSTDEPLRSMPSSTLN